MTASLRAFGLGKLTKVWEITGGPRENVCPICLNAYKSLGYDVKYGTKAGFKNYKAVIAKDPGVHHMFLSAMKAWIKSFNDDDEQEMRLKTKKSFFSSAGVFGIVARRDVRLQRAQEGVRGGR